MIKRDVLDLAVVSAISSHLSLQVGVSDVPSDTPNIPYVIVFQSPSPGYTTYEYGGWSDPEDMPCFDFLIKSVGRDHRETARTQSRVRDVMVARTPGGDGYTYPIIASGLIIIERATISPGAIVAAAGPSLFEVGDIYRVKVQEDAP